MEKKKNPTKSAREMANDAKLRQMLRTLPTDHHGFSQAEIARKSGVAQQTISQIERGAMIKITQQIEKYLTE